MTHAQRFAKHLNKLGIKEPLPCSVHTATFTEDNMTLLKLVSSKAEKVADEFLVYGTAARGSGTLIKDFRSYTGTVRKSYRAHDA